MAPTSRPLTPANQREFEGFVTWLKANPEYAFAAAMEQKLLALTLMQDQAQIRVAMQESGVTWLDRWRIMQGLPVANAAEQVRGDGLGAEELTRLRAEEAPRGKV